MVSAVEVCDKSSHANSELKTNYHNISRYLRHKKQRLKMMSALEKQEQAKTTRHWSFSFSTENYYKRDIVSL
ncbi:CLUMA_CG008801, isoform A [Clunio marinus]|uniref:CLUMA_CG008801, isoform A n=1 Tax=Clunio marinus TaxID=568069 RepID=A0A1J1I4L1_9DIPT|nr:CLUMA_CG008801, isoform A [Clunio marinus]